jgi:hypothetical protein
VRKFRPLLATALAAAAALVTPAPPAAEAAWSCTPGWRLVQSVPGASLSGVSFVPGTSQAWAVGEDSHWSRPRTMRFDGRRWSEVPAPAPPGMGSWLSAVFARSASDVWAVGGYWDEREIGRTLVMHWDGSAWSIMPSPNPPSMVSQDGARLVDVVALGPDDVWAVGSVVVADATPSESPLMMHWDGITGGARCSSATATAAGRRSPRPRSRATLVSMA